MGRFRDWCRNRGIGTGDGGATTGADGIGIGGTNDAEDDLAGACGADGFGPVGIGLGDAESCLGCTSVTMAPIASNISAMPSSMPFLDFGFTFISPFSVLRKNIKRRHAQYLFCASE